MPSSHHLVVTTSKGVYSWNREGIVEVFSSRSEGIVAARKVQTTKDLLAVADSQLVILHDYNRDMQQTYQLRREDQGQVRMLYFDKYSQRLFFTTTVQNAVQSYSLRTGFLLDPAPTHPSPLVVFAVSPTFDILLSSSANPPTTYLTNIVLNRLPMLLQPECSTSAVVAASFHPERGNIFALGFADGTIATFNAASFREEQSLDQRTLYTGSRGEVAHIKKLHAPVSSIASLKNSSLTCPLSSTCVPEEEPRSFRDCKTGIRAVSFVPGLACTTASVGTDGRCCIVQFQKSGFQGKSQLLRVWSVNGPATSLSVVRSIPGPSPSQVDGSVENGDWHSVTEGLLLAIGRDDGRVLLYGIDGNLLAIKDFSESGRVLDLEWLDGSGDRPFTASLQRDGAASPSRQNDSQVADRPQNLETSLQTDSSSPPKIMVKLHVRDRPSDGNIQSPKPENDSLGPRSQSVDVTHSLASPSRQSSKAGKRRIRRKKPFVVRTPARTSSVSATSQSTNSSKRKVSLRRTSTRRNPTVPPRPVPKPGGKLDLRHRETAMLKSLAAQQESQETTQTNFRQRNARASPTSADIEFLGPPPTLQSIGSFSSVKSSRRELPHPTRRSLSPEQLRTAVSNDLNALTGSDLKPIPPPASPSSSGITNAHDGASKRVPEQYTLAPLSIMPPPRANVEDPAPRDKDTADATFVPVALVHEAPTEAPLHKEKTSANIVHSSVANILQDRQDITLEKEAPVDLVSAPATAPRDTRTTDRPQKEKQSEKVVSPAADPIPARPLSRVPSTREQPHTTRTPQKRPILKRAQEDVSKPAVPAENAVTGGRQSLNSQSSTSTGTIVDWHYPPPIHRIKQLLTQGQAQGHRDLSTVSETTTTASQPKKDSGTPDVTVLEWRPPANATATRESPPIKTNQAEKSHRTTQASQNTNNQKNLAQQPASNYSTPMVSPKTEPQFSAPDEVSRLAVQGTKTSNVASPATNLPQSKAIASAGSPAEASDMRNNEGSKPPLPVPLAGPVRPIPTTPAVPVAILPISTTPRRSIAEAILPPSLHPALPTTPKPSTPTQRATTTTNPDRHSLLFNPSNRPSDRASSSIQWPTSFYGGFGSSEAGIGADPSLFTLEETIRLECLDLKEQIAFAFQEQKSWLGEFVRELLRERDEVVDRLEGENNRLREEVERLRGRRRE